MGKDEDAGGPNSTPTLNSFASGGKLGPIGDRNEYEQRLNALPSDQKEFAQESVRLADLCQYLSTQKIDIPPQLVDRVSGLHALAIPQRIQSLKEVNKALMEYLHKVGHDSGIRH